MRKTHFFLIIVLLLFSSCQKDLFKKKITVKGAILDIYTDWTVSKSFIVYFYVDGDLETYTTTDENGFFEIELIKGQHYTYSGNDGLSPSYTIIDGDFICDEDEYLKIQAKPISEPVASIIHYDVLEHTRLYSKVKIDFFIADGIENLDNFYASDISFSSDDNTVCNIVDFQKKYQYSEGNFSVELSIDQSGSIEDTDPKDRRLIAANLFCSRMSSSDYVYLSAFASNGYLPYDITGWGDFTNNGFDYFSIIEDLKNLVGGGTPLYQAAVSAILNLSSNGPTENKVLILFTDGEDTDGGYSVDDVIQIANNHNVKIYTVGLGSGTNNYILSKIANNTGGATLSTTDSKKLISFFGVVGNIIKGEGTYYSVILDVYHPEGTVAYATDFLETYLKFYYNGEESSNYLFIDLSS